MVLELSRSNLSPDELKRHNDEILYLGLSDSGLEFCIGGCRKTLSSDQIKNTLGNFQVEIIRYSTESVLINFIAEIIPSN